MPRQVSVALRDERLRPIDKLRLVLLYSLRYQKEGMEKVFVCAFVRVNC